MKTKPRSRQHNIVIQELNDEILIYDLSVNRAFCLNHSAALVWRAADGENDISEMSRRLSRDLQVTVSDDFVWLVLDRLKKENLLANPEEITQNFNGLSRRQVIKRIGFTSMLALPTITSLVAPSSVHAASGTCGGSCQCSGLLGTVAVCPPGFAECGAGCSCVIANQQTDCFSVEGVFACNGTCSSEGQQNTCPSATECQCIGDSNSGVSSCSAALGGCPGTCGTCQTSIGNCFKPGGEGAFVCPGVCV